MWMKNIKENQTEADDWQTEYNCAVSHKELQTTGIVIIYSLVKYYYKMDLHNPYTVQYNTIWIILEALCILFFVFRGIKIRILS